MFAVLAFHAYLIAYAMETFKCAAHVPAQPHIDRSARLSEENGVCVTNI